MVMVADLTDATTTLGNLLDALGPALLEPAGGELRSLPVRAVAIDSRRVEPGDLFVALPGTMVDGHDFIEAAIARGAVAVMGERPSTEFAVPYVAVDNAARALATIASRYYGDPAQSLRLCGVTGTNGKTSVSHLIRSILQAGGRKTGIIGTLGHGVDTLVKDPHTTPDALTLHSWFRAMRDQNCFGVVMEVSSHAVRQHRTWGLDFEVGILTNVTHDHLDFHKSMSDYKAAKAEFCYSLGATSRKKAPGTLVFWLDDANAREIGTGFRGRKIAVGTTAESDWRVSDVSVSVESTRFTLNLPGGDALPVTMKLLGGFVPANAAVAAAAAATMGAGRDDIQQGLEAITAVAGRFEALGGGDRPVVVIDYAHTPDGFERVLQTCRDLGPNRLVTVFGCGGDRDRDKRPIMGELAERFSDAVILTTDNPRTERVESIVDDIRAGMSGSGEVIVELDRALAIEMALSSCKPGDVVALLGKGHEAYQIIGSERTPYSERAQAEVALARWRTR
jgi:UDP-N-acetylmuramoyl-L-alanyl-D-glutamate--2,6-diaminopimelate ligase